MARNSYKARPRRGLGGFTLVELVVVIAVLAILAGVGAVAYNGYIEYAKKGQDRATVGEIMHALELADYTDPLGYTEVYFTSNGGIQVPVDVSGKVTKALEDAFGGEGALASVKPSYEDWKEQEKTFNLEGIKDIISSINSGDLSGITGLTNYIDAVSGGGAASFSQDIDELWGTVGEFVDVAQKGLLGSDVIKDNYIKDIIALSTGASTEIVEVWATGKDFVNDMSGESQVKLAVQLARNYAFVSYAKGHPLLTDDMRTQLDKYATVTDVDAVGNTHVSTIAGQSYIKDNALSGGNWEAIRAQYLSSGQARIDALAYCGMMDVAGNIPNIKNAPDDKTLLNDFSSYTDELSTILGDPSIINAIQSGSLTRNATVNGNGICIKVTKLGDMLSFTVDPPEANPRGNGASVNTGGSEGGSEGGSCELDHDSTLNVTIGSSGTNLTINPEKSSIEICTKGGTKTCAIKFNAGDATNTSLYPAVNGISITGGDGKVSISKYSADQTTGTAAWVITATEATEEPITLTLDAKLTIGGMSISATPVTISVRVH